MDRARTPRDDVEDIADSSASRRRDDPNATRKHRQRPLQLFRKQSFRLQTIAQLFECNPQSAGADGIETIDDEFVFTTRRVERKLSARAHVQTVRGSKPDPRVCRAKALCTQLRILVLKGEIPMARRVRFKV